MRLGFKIAKRFLKSNMSQTLLIILGIAIGVSVQIFIGSLIQGLQQSLLDKTIGDSPHITIYSETDNQKITNYEKLIDQLKEVNPRIEKISVVEDNPAFLQYEDQSQSILIRGFEIDKANQIYNFIDRTVEGTYPQGDNEIMVGIELKEEYDLNIQDVLKITTTSQQIFEMNIVGFYDLKVAAINKNWGITTLQTAQNLFDSSENITSVEIQVSDDAVFNSDVIAKEIDQNLNTYNISVDNWKDQNEQLLSGLQGQSISSIMIQVFVMISVVLGIASVLAITVMQKSKQIGILKAMGIKNVSTSYLFLFEGLILGFFGAIFGILFGLGLSFAFTQFALNPDGTPVVPLYINTSFIIISGLIAIAASVFAALLPAIRSFKLNPIDIIRNN